MSCGKKRSGVTRILGRTRSWQEYPPVSLGVHISSICSSVRQFAPISSLFASSVFIIHRSVPDLAAALTTSALTRNGISLWLTSSLSFANKASSASKRFPERSKSCSELCMCCQASRPLRRPLSPHPAALMLVNGEKAKALNMSRKLPFRLQPLTSPVSVDGLVSP